MQSISKSFMMLAVAGFAAGCENQSTNSDSGIVADAIYSGGVIYTVDASSSVANTMAVKDGKIIYVGTIDGAAKLKGETTQSVDLAGNVVFPGFTDTHAHLLWGGQGLLGLELFEASNEEEAAKAIAEYASANPDKAVIEGFGWELDAFPEGNPMASIIDAVVPDRPVVLMAADGHNSWLNSKALEMAGITADTPDPEGGRIERHEDGTPSGTLRESAMDLGNVIVPMPSLEDSTAFLNAAVNYQLSNGMVATIDASVRDVDDAAWLEAAKRPDFPHRARLSMIEIDALVGSKVNENNVGELVSAFEKRRATYQAIGSTRVQASTIKIFVDGVPENHTAALEEPYIGSPVGDDHAGTSFMSEAVLAEYAKALNTAGFQIHMHAIGDRAVRMGLDAVEGIGAPLADKPYMSHVQIVNPDQFARFKDLGVTASLNSLWHLKDEYISTLTEPFIGPVRSQWLYPAASFKNAGASYTWGSDWNVSSSHPFYSMETAVLRKDPNNPDHETWLPGETLTVDDMVRALTMGGATLMGQDAWRGSLETGKVADFIIVDADPYKIDPHAISDIKILSTFIEGKKVYELKP